MIQRPSVDSALPSQRKCFEILLNRDQPCSMCPIKMNEKKINQGDQKNNNLSDLNFTSSIIEINSQLYKPIVSEFENGNKFFIFYENQSVLNQLKSSIIQNEKMNVIGQLANHLTHELNNPLTGMKLAVDLLLLDKDLEKNLNSDLLEIKKGLIRCEKIISNFKNFTTQDSELVVVDLNDIVQNTIPFLKSILRIHQLFIDVKNLKVLVNYVQLQQIIFNLIKNSCQAMSTKGVIKIYSVVQTNYLDLVFEDTGPGLDSNMYINLFKPFSTTKEIGQGTGLGLYISKIMLKKMNADLIYDENYKSGARFLVRFNL